jgi:glycosyltransferase involved in cell wall biosynthesis
MGRQPFPEIKDLLQRCRGLVFPGMEDFGIVPVEAMAAGAPVIAYGKGGALETVINGKTGILFPEQTVESLIQAVQQVESGAVTFDPATLHAHAATFDKSIFKQRIQAFVDDALLASGPAVQRTTLTTVRPALTE